MKFFTHSAYVLAVNEANRHNYLYFVESNPEITDIEFDTLYYAIEDYERTHPDEILPDSPTQRVGSDLHSDAHTTPHRTPMLSCQKAKTVAEVLKWMQQTNKRVARALGHNYPDQVEYSVEWKYDGISCSLVYQDGHLIEASTRGDHKFGLDILHHVANITNIPKELRKGLRLLDGRWTPCAADDVPFDGHRVEVRGEIILPFADLPAVKAYNDTRTAASAILNTDTPTPYDHLLQFKAWQLITEDSISIDMKDYSNTTSLDTLYETYGFDIEEVDIVTIASVERIIQAYADVRKDNTFPTDGLVIKLQDKTVWSLMGATEHHPKSCIAYKFPSVKAVTYCQAISETIGEKTGKVTPICWFTPVTIGGKTYEKCSLGSEATMRRIGIHVGSKIEVSLRNDVLIQVDRVID